MDQRLKLVGILLLLFVGFFAFGCYQRSNLDELSSQATEMDLALTAALPLSGFRDLWCDIRSFFLFPCSDPLPKPSNEYVIVEPGKEESSVATEVTVATSTPPSLISSSGNTITNIYPLERETIREVIVRYGEFDTASLVSQSEYDRQIDALLRSIERTASASGDDSDEAIDEFADSISESFTTNLLTVNGNASLLGSLKDSSGSAGTSGYILSSTGTSTTWVAPGSIGGNVFSQGGNAFGVPATLGTTDAQPLYLITGSSTALTILSNRDVGIGTSTPSAKLQVTGTAGAGDIFAISSSTNTRLLTVTAAGNVGIGTTTPTSRLSVVGTSYLSGNVGINAAPTSNALTVYGTTDIGLNATNALRFSNDTVSNVLQSYVSGAVGRLVLNKDGGRVLIGGGTATTKANFQIVQSVTGNFINANAIVQHGMEENSRLTGTGTNNAYAGYTATTQILDSAAWDHYAGFQVDTAITGSPTITDVRAFSANLNFGTSNTPTITNSYGMYILNPIMGSAAVTNNYGVYVANLSGATNNYSIYTGTAKSYFGGNVGIGTSTPSAKLQVTGTAGADDIFAISSSTNTRLLTVTAAGNVGIGTTTPSSRLSIMGDGVVNSMVFEVVANSSNMAHFTNTSALAAASGAGMSGYTFSLPTSADQRLGFVTFGSKNAGSSTINAIGVAGFAEGAWTAGSSNPAYLVFQTTPSGATARLERMRITGSGDVGIGTSTPSAKLQVTGTAGADDIFAISSSTNSRLLTVKASGNVGIGTTTPTSNLTVVGVVQSTSLLGGATNLTTDANGNIIRDPSDEKLKTDVQTLENALDTVLNLRGVTYYWKDTGRFGAQKEIGFIAQEVDPFLPEVVQKGGEYWSLNRSNMLAVVVEALKEMWANINQRFASQDERIRVLESEVESLRATVGAASDDDDDNDGQDNNQATTTNPVASSSTTVIPPPVLGCTDAEATNFNSDAVEDDGSCEYIPEIPAS